MKRALKTLMHLALLPGYITVALIVALWILIDRRMSREAVDPRYC